MYLTGLDYIFVSGITLAFSLLFGFLACLHFGTDDSRYLLIFSLISFLVLMPFSMYMANSDKSFYHKCETAQELPRNDADWCNNYLESKKFKEDVCYRIDAPGKIWECPI